METVCYSHLDFNSQAVSLLVSTNCVTLGITNCDGLMYNVFGKTKLEDRVVNTPLSSFSGQPFQKPLPQPISLNPHLIFMFPRVYLF